MPSGRRRLRVGLCRALLRTGPPRPSAGRPTSKVLDMADLAFIALTVAFFAAVALVARRLDRS